MDDSVNAVVLLIGLAVGVDYSMFYLKREREERAAGRAELPDAAHADGTASLSSSTGPATPPRGPPAAGDERCQAREA